MTTVAGSVAEQVEQRLAAMAMENEQLRGEVGRLQTELTGHQQTQQAEQPRPAAATIEGLGRPKMPKPKSYDGSQLPGAVENFVFDCSQYFVGMTYPVSLRVCFASSLLEGSAKTWWRFVCEQTPDALTLYTWEMFSAALTARFRAVNA